MAPKRATLTVFVSVVLLVASAFAVWWAVDLSATSQSSKPAVVSQSPKFCDGSGDAKPGDDCVQQHLKATSATPTIKGGSSYPIEVTTHPGLRSNAEVAEVQYRSVNSNGTTGQWWGHRRVLLKANGASPDVHEISACAPTTPGNYQVRTAVWVSAPKSKAHIDGTTSALVSPGGTSIPARFTGNSLTAQSSPSLTVPGDVVTSSPSALTATSGGVGCTNSPDDEMLIEYFNQILFNEQIEIQVSDAGPAFNLQIICPQPLTPSIPGPNFSLVMATASNSASTSCSSTTPIVITDGSTPDFCTSGANMTCQFLVTYSNAVTAAVYSQTMIEITLPSGTTTTILPNLEPATLPICNNSLNPCQLTGTCSLSSTKLGALTLCQDATSCSSVTPDSPSSGYSYNSNVYFKATLQHQVT